MRVITGSAKGRKLQSVPGSTTRPILDRVKTALFDMLRPALPGIRVLDLFAGSGAVGIEALSEGAAHCVFLDLERAAVETIRANLAHTQLAEKGEVRQADAFRYLRQTAHAFDLIFVAPPQYKGLWMEALRHIAERPQILTPRAQVVVQIDPKEYEPMQLSGLVEAEQRKYGNTLLVFLRSVSEP